MAMLRKVHLGAAIGARWLVLRLLALMLLMGGTSVALAVLRLCDPLPLFGSAVPWVVAVYCGWVGSMVVLIAAPRLVAPDRERGEPPK